MIYYHMHHTCDLQIIHRLGPRHHLPAGHHTDTAILPQEVHVMRDLIYWQEAMFHSEEGVFLAAMDHLACFRGGFTMLSMSRGGDGQIHQVVIVVDPHVQDELRLHLDRDPSRCSG